MTNLELVLKIIVRAPDVWTRREIVLHGRVDAAQMPNVERLVFDIERTLNEHLPQIRVHTTLLGADSEAQT